MPGGVSKSRDNAGRDFSCGHVGAHAHGHGGHDHGGHHTVGTDPPVSLSRGLPTCCASHTTAFFTWVSSHRMGPSTQGDWMRVSPAGWWKVRMQVYAPGRGLRRGFWKPGGMLPSHPMGWDL